MFIQKKGKKKVSVYRFNTKMKQQYINYSNRAMLGGVGVEAIMDPEGGCNVSLSRWHALKKKNNGYWLLVRKGRESREETCFCFGLFTLTKYRLKGNHDDFGHVSSTSQFCLRISIIYTSPMWMRSSCHAYCLAK